MQINGDLIINGTNTKLKDTINSKFSYAQMRTGFSNKRIYEEEKVTDYGSGIGIGDFSYSTNSGYLLVPAGTAKVIEIKGLLCGWSYCDAYFSIEYGDGTTFDWYSAGYAYQSAGFLTQIEGNNYWKLPMPSITIEIPDNTKDLRIYLTVSPYNTDFFDMNAGFGATSWISVTKLA